MQVIEKIRKLPDVIQQYFSLISEENTLLKKNNKNLQESNVDLQESNTNLQEYTVNLQNEIDLLREELRLALFRKYGKSSEKIDPSQLELFSEAELETKEEPIVNEEVTISEHKLTRKGRKPLDPNIPREDVVHDLSENEKVCGCGAE